MEVIGYVTPFVKNISKEEQIKILYKNNITRIVLEENEAENDRLLYEVICVLGKGDRIVISNIEVLKLPCIQLGVFLREVSQKGIELMILSGDKTLNNEEYIQFLIDISDAEKYYFSERTIKGLSLAKEEGRTGGRPKISFNLVKRINDLYYKEGYSVREIVKECEVSLGTVYKYININR